MLKSAIEVSPESLKMEKSVKKREKKHARAKRQAEKQARESELGGRGRGSRQGEGSNRRGS